MFAQHSTDALHSVRSWRPMPTLRSAMPFIAPSVDASKTSCVHGALSKYNCCFCFCRGCFCKGNKRIRRSRLQLPTAAAACSCRKLQQQSCKKKNNAVGASAQASWSWVQPSSSKRSGIIMIKTDLCSGRCPEAVIIKNNEKLDLEINNLLSLQQSLPPAIITWREQHLPIRFSSPGQPSQQRSLPCSTSH